MFWFDFNWQIQQLLNLWWWPINLGLLGVLGLLGYFAYKKPAYAVGATLIALPTYLLRSTVWLVPLTFLELCIWVTFFGWLFGSVRQRTLTANHLYRYRAPITLLLAAATIGMLVSPDLRAAAGLWKAYFVEPILFYIVVANVAAEPKGRNVVLWSLGLATLSVSLLGIYQWFTGFGIAEPGWLSAEHRRVTAMFTSPNAVGLYLGPVVALYAGWLLAELKNKKHAALKAAVLLLAILAIAGTSSQGTLLGLAAAAAFLAFFGWSKKWTAALLLLATVAVLALPATRSAAWSLVTFRDPAGQNRLELLRMSQEYLTSSPSRFLLGGGILGFAKIQNQLRDPLRLEPLLYPHNIIFNFWLEIGLLGLVAFGWLVVIFFKTGFQRGVKKDWLKLGIMAAMVAIMTHGLVDVPYFKNDLAVLFWVIIALLPNETLSTRN